MGISVGVGESGLRVILRGWDRALNMRSGLEFNRAIITAALVAERSSLEPLVDHRVLGWARTVV